ncbi:hypothetical protein A2865_00700 [Candidatus Woesebacteria bacterium RIFCSPHIGHO2_01_FULL_39_17]|uniref:Addiction module toxin, RelE/StbE family n=3 Tax=Candidatus Woeseibacteriota TaxID=1752722 RepID=A0A0G0NBC8_9BACT|nr:MAG: RelE-like protein [Microgenomates group bacterium GW2011_GWC1_38_12]KKQ93434.1 MAG: hypothetical protein UT19_C0012G0023 [Candidatus Woesebacteria bacterium GW2011_GWB1_39_10b]KKR13474.1 MAG: hypothetical protein UT40_C0016G0005 [Candidatus Woesebacteria bacterium GW2011_GWA1_39_21b]OGM22919.1 MAG: hypothetical protein A2865_00700 [Candidatus Woesebacteria bacterium RIFCSPHIGHO2_01_FULL_39_17]OGM65391.1 MAG: hypothetical protein A3A52_00585 [Candidatus Woesebacteria bacterium RIFCSPLOWO
MYSIKYDKRAVKQIKRLPLSERKRITDKIHQLGADILPSQLNVKKFTKTKKSFRLKIGKIRVIYQVDKDMKLILIKKVGHRGDIYKR